MMTSYISNPDFMESKQSCFPFLSNFSSATETKMINVTLCYEATQDLMDI